MVDRSSLVIRVSGDAKAFNQLLREVRKETETLERSLSTIAKKSAIAFTALTAVLGLTVKSFATFEFALAGVGKTTDIADEELQGFGKTLQGLSRRLPFSTNELLAISQAAGQLGVRGKENLLNFTETIAKLGTATDLAGEEAALALSRILTVTNEGFGNIDKFASVIVALGNRFAASESEITRMTTEVSRSIAVFGASAAQSAALGAAMKSIGVQAEAGGSGVGRAFRAIDASIRGGGLALEDLSKLTGLTGDQLKKTFAVDSVKVFRLFIEGLGRVEAAGGSSTQELEKYNLKGQELLKVLPPLALNSELLGRALNIAAEEAKNGTALNIEYEKISKTLNVQTKILGNTIQVLSVEIGARLKPIVISIIDAIKSLVDKFLALEETTKDAIVNTALFAAGALAVVAALSTLGVALISLRALFIVLGVTAASTWAIVTLGLSAVVAGIITVVSLMGGWEATIIKVQASYQLLANKTIIAFNKLRIVMNELIAKMFDLAAATLEAIPGDVFQKQIQNFKDMAKAVKQVSGDIIDENIKLGISFNKIVSNIEFERQLKKRLQLQKEAAEKAAEANSEEALALLAKEKEKDEASLAAELERKKLAEEARLALEEEQRIRRGELENEIKEVKLELETVEDLEEEARLIVKLEKLQEIRNRFLSKEQIAVEKAIETLKKKRAEDRKNEIKKQKQAFDMQLQQAKFFFDTNKSFEENFKDFKEKVSQQAFKFALRIGNDLLAANKEFSVKTFLLTKVAALKSIIVNTAAGIGRALAEFPFPASIAIGALIAAAGAAQAAAVVGTVIGAQDGGVVGDGTSAPSGDRFPFLLEKGEIVAPKRNFDEVVESVARNRGFTRNGDNADTEDDERLPQEVNVIIDLTEDAAQIITAQQFESTTLGVDR